MGSNPRTAYVLIMVQSAFSKLRSLAKCSLDDSVRRLLLFTQLANLATGRANRVAAYTSGSAAGLTQGAEKALPIYR